VQRLAGGDIVVRRARPATITESQLKAHLPELKRAYSEGRIDVRTVTGDLIDLETMKVASRQPSPPQPKPPLDSAADDKQGVGEKMPPYKGAKAVDEPAESPKVMSIPEGGEPDEKEEIPPDRDPASARRKMRE
jgi:hypothetical protein